MTAVLTICLGTLVFVEQDIPILRAGGTDPLTGQVSCNFVSADIDNDGHNDLVFRDAVVFQRDMGYSMADLHPLPVPDGPCLIDVWAGQIAFLTHDALLFASWDGDDWSLQRYELLPPLPDSFQDWKKGDSTPRFSRYLYDVNDDQTAELAIVAEDGVHIYSQQRDHDTLQYHHVARWDILPAMRLCTVSTNGSTKPAHRIPSMPVREMSCMVWFERAGITVLEPERLPNNAVRYMIHQYVFDEMTSQQYKLPEPVQWITSPMPSVCRPFRMGTHGKLGFAGSRWEWLERASGFTPVNELYVSIDEGESLDLFRSRAFPSITMFTDYNGNGKLDLVVQHTDLFGKGMRESFIQYMTSQRIDHEIHIHLQDDTGRFPREPSIRTMVTIELESPPIRGSVLFERYSRSDLFSLAGDFTGNGYRDLLVQDKPDKLSIYAGGPDGFSRRAIATLDTAPDHRFAMLDVDGDQRADVVLRWPSDDGASEDGAVYLSRDLVP